MIQGKRYNRIFSTKVLLAFAGIILSVGAFSVSAQTPDDRAYNRAPLIEFRDKLIEWKEQGSSYLYKPFKYSFEATIDDGGHFVVEQGNPPKFEGDPKSAEIIRSAVKAFSDSGMLKLLQGLKSTKTKIDLTQDGKQFFINVESMHPSDSKARQLSSAINMAMNMFKATNQDATDKDTLDLLNMMQVSTSGANLIIKIVVPNNFVETLYQKHKKDREEKTFNEAAN